MERGKEKHLRIRKQGKYLASIIVVLKGQDNEGIQNKATNTS